MLEASYREKPFGLFKKRFFMMRCISICVNFQDLLQDVYKLRSYFQRSYELRFRGFELKTCVTFSCFRLVYLKVTLRKLVVFRCWGVRGPLSPDAPLSSVSGAPYDWDDLQR
jgi:hypothetical protein